MILLPEQSSVERCIDGPISNNLLLIVGPGNSADLPFLMLAFKIYCHTDSNMLIFV